MADRIALVGGEHGRRGINQMQTDIEVIKHRLDDLREHNSQINAKMDLVLQMQLDLVALREQQGHAKQAIDRAFDSIAHTREWIQSTDMKAQLADGKINRAMSYVKGGAVVASITFGLLLGIGQWYLIQQTKQIEQLYSDFRIIDRRLLLMESRPVSTPPRGRIE